MLGWPLLHKQGQPSFPFLFAQKTKRYSKKVGAPNAVSSVSSMAALSIVLL